MKATFVRDVTDQGFQGSAKLWKLDNPYVFEVHGETRSTEYIVSSAINSIYACETYIFPASEDGLVDWWTDLPGSQQGVGDHEAVIRDFEQEVS